MGPSSLSSSSLFPLAVLASHLFPFFSSSPFVPCFLGRRGAWAVKAKNGGSFPQHAKAEVAAPAAPAVAKFYPADDVKKPVGRRAAKNPTRLRASITPGTVLILLAGRFRGSRVVFLKQLASGLLLVSGPFGVNGVPLRRVNQAYVIATSTKVDVAAAAGAVAAVSDDLFKKTASSRSRKTKRGEDGFFAEQAAPEPLPAAFVEAQKAVDAGIAKGLSADLKGYLKAKFSLRSGDRPHLMKF